MLLPIITAVLALASPVLVPPGPVPAAGVGPALRPGDIFHLQLSGTVRPARLPAAVTVVESDVDETPRSTLRQLRARGVRSICYMSAGSWEEYRADADRFPRRLLGRRLDGWPQERWLDIRARATLRPLLGARMDRCARKGFVGVDFDNVDGFTNRTGFPLTRRHQVLFNAMLARMARNRGLSPGLKNALDLIPRLEPVFDWAVNEQCVTYAECWHYRPFVRAGKEVVVVEYGQVRRSRVCAVTGRLGLTGMFKHLDLGPWTRRC